MSPVHATKNAFSFNLTSLSESFCLCRLTHFNQKYCRSAEKRTVSKDDADCHNSKRAYSVESTTMSMNRTTRTKSNGGRGQARHAMHPSTTSKSAGSSYVMMPGANGAEALRRIRNPNPTDVLCGRGGSINSHPGNKVFREWVHERKNDYNLAMSKAEKARVSREVIDLVRAQNPPGKFLTKETTSASAVGTATWWIEIDDLKAMAKTSQALREGAPTIRAQHKDELDEKKHQSHPKPRRPKKDSTASKAAARTSMPPPPAMAVSMSPDMAVEALRTAAEAAKHGLGQPIEGAGVKRPSPIAAPPSLSYARYAHAYEPPRKTARKSSREVDRDTAPTPPLETPPLMPMKAELPDSFMSLSAKSSNMKRSHSLALSDMSTGDICEDFVNPFEDESEDRNGKRLAYATRASGESSTNSVGDRSFGSLLKKSSSDLSRQRSNDNNAVSSGSTFRKNASSRSVSVDEGTNEETFGVSKNCFCECGSALEEGKVCPCGALADHLAWRDDSIGGQDWLHIPGFMDTLSTKEPDQIVPVSP